MNTDPRMQLAYFSIFLKQGATLKTQWSPASTWEAISTYQPISDGRKRQELLEHQCYWTQIVFSKSAYVQVLEFPPNLKCAAVLKRWLSGQERWLFFQKTRVWLPTPKSGSSQLPVQPQLLEILPKSSSGLYKHPHSYTHIHGDPDIYVNQNKVNL